MVDNPGNVVSGDKVAGNLQPMADTSCRAKDWDVRMTRTAGTDKHRVAILAALTFLAAAACGGAEQRPLAPASLEPGVQEELDEARQQLIDRRLPLLGITDTAVLEAMRRAPRHRFMPEDQIERAYDNRAAPIGFGQTISQPYVVALMTELLDVQEGDKVLEVGTGSGYQAAVLGELTDQVWSIEIIPELAERAAQTLESLEHPVEVKQGDGYFGWPEHAPFDGIIVTAAPDHIPQPLVQQLAEGGNLVLPVGPSGSYQTLWRITKTDGEIRSENITDVIFVPLIRED